MLELILKNRISRKISLMDTCPLQFIARRRLSSREMVFVRAMGMKRYYLPRLGEPEKERFFEAFEKFWDDVIRDFGKDHYFWRNAVSSKMQEWEGSCGYLMLLLFTLTRVSQKEDLRLLVIVEGVEEMRVWEQWAGVFGWTILSRESRWACWLARCCQEIRNILLFLYRTGRCLRKKFLLSKASVSFEKERGEKTVLMTSFYYPWSFQGGTYRDPFWGELHRFFEKEGYNVIFLCDSLAPVNRSIREILEDCRDVIIYNPYALITTWKLLLGLGRVFLRRIKPVKGEFLGCDFSKLLQWHGRRFTHAFHIEAEVFYLAVWELCRHIRFEQFLQIYEGNVIERACIQAFRQCCAAPIVGYSQGVIFDSNLKLTLTPGEKKNKPLPDDIVCTGKYAQGLLSKTRRQNLPALRSGCALRTLSVSERTGLWGNSRDILMALDGTPDADTVLDWLIERAGVLENYRVRIRPHPNVPFKDIVWRCVGKLPRFFILSEKTLDEDLKECFCVFYRHTSIGLQALMNGVPAVHLAVNTPLSGDPIEGLTQGKWVVRSKEELSSALVEINALSADEYRKLAQASLDALYGYFSAPREERLHDFIKENHRYAAA